MHKIRRQTQLEPSIFTMYCQNGNFSTIFPVRFKRFFRVIAMLVLNGDVIIHSKLGQLLVVSLDRLLISLPQCFLPFVCRDTPLRMDSLRLLQSLRLHLSRRYANPLKRCVTLCQKSMSDPFVIDITIGVTNSKQCPLRCFYCQLSTPIRLRVVCRRTHVFTPPSSGNPIEAMIDDWTSL